jgi:protein involved in polysaccharide export with SLBB domain
MSRHVARFLRNTTVRTNVLTRVAVLGAVRLPGFYYVSPDRPISDLLMVAGGPSAEANLNELEVLRSQRVLVNAKDSKRLIKEGRTLEQLDLQSGDEVRIPVKRKANWGTIIQLLFVATSLFFGFLQFLMWYYNRQEY